MLLQRSGLKLMVAYMLKLSYTTQRLVDLLSADVTAHAHLPLFQPGQQHQMQCQSQTLLALQSCHVGY